VVAVRAPVDTEPEVALPVENPVPAHDVAFVEPQVRVEDDPEATEVGLAESVAVGLAEVMVIGRVTGGLVSAKAAALNPMRNAIQRYFMRPTP
jgi:hypothetical protein